MLRLWVESYREAGSSNRASIALSIVAHVAIIALAVDATAAPPELPDGQLANRVYYMPPPVRVPRLEHRIERISYVRFGTPNITGTFHDGVTGQSLDGRRGIMAGLPSGLDSINVRPLPALNGHDSVYSRLEVDFTVERDPMSAAPQYPRVLLDSGVEGGTLVRYVVDTSGRADLASFFVVRASHPLFADAVRAALGGMHFSPARIGRQKVRQMVEQEFTFRIDPALLQAALARKGRDSTARSPRDTTTRGHRDSTSG